MATFLFPFSVRKWTKWLEEVQADQRDAVPIERALRWIQIESGGNACSIGRVGKPGEQYPGHVYEAGLAQTYFSSPGAIAHGVTVDQVRADCGSSTSMPQNLTDERRRFHARLAIETVRDHRRRARERLLRHGASLAENTNAFWCWVKLVHAAPAMFDFLGAAKRHYGFFPSWSQFRAYVDGLSYESRYAINKIIATRAAATPAPGKDDYLTRVWRNCEHFAGMPGGGGGFVELELLLLLGVAAYVLSRFVV